MKKYIRLELLKNLLLLILLSVVVGCGGGGSSGSGNNNPAQNTSVILDSSSGSIANGAPSTDLNPLMVLKFSTTIVRGSINTDTIILSTSSNGANPVNLTAFTINQANTKVSFSTQAPLLAHKNYYLIVKNVMTSDGENINNNFSFTTGSSIAPAVTMTDPSNGDTGVSNATTIGVMFNEPVNNLSLTNVVLHSGSANGPAVQLQSITANNESANSYIIATEQPLNYLTTYYLSFSSNITDNSGNKLSPTVFSFTTAREPFLYVTNYGGGDVIKCDIAVDGTPENCADSGAGNVFGNPYGIAPNYSNNQMYITGTNGLMECDIGEDGRLSGCAKRIDFYSVGTPLGVAINQLKNVIYVSGFDSAGTANLALTECAFTGDQSAMLCNQTMDAANGQIFLNNSGSALYIAGFNGESADVQQCTLDSFGFTTSCASAFASPPPFNGFIYGIVSNNDGNVAYFSVDSDQKIESQSTSQIWGCNINSDGTFSECVTVLDNYALGRLNGDSPGQMIINKYSGNIYFPSISTNNLLNCKVVGQDFSNVLCAANIVMPDAPISTVPNSTGITIRY